MTTTTQPQIGAARPSVNLAWLTVVLGALSAFAPFSVDMYLASLPKLAESFHASAGEVQLGLSLFFLGLSLGQLVFGPLTDRFGRKPPLLAGIALFATASLLIAFAPNIESFVLLRLLQAFGGCAGMIIGRAVISDLFEEREAASVLSLIMMVQGVGPIIAPVIGGYIIVAAGWPAVFLFLTVLGLACFAGTCWAVPETLPQERRKRENPGQILRTYASLLCKRGFILPTLCGSFAFASLFAFISDSPFVYMELYGVAPQHFGWLFGLNAVGIIFSAQLNRLLLRRFTSEEILGGALAVNILMGALLLLILQTSSLLLLVATLWIIFATLPLIAANTVALAMAEGSEHLGSASGLIGVTQFGLAALSSSLIGLLHNGTAYPMAGMIFLCSLLAGLTALMQRRLSLPGSEENQL
jgi:DHA1 family bicyclomycin/chloramphenicol resistance-like MFS transporter